MTEKDAPAPSPGAEPKSDPAQQPRQEPDDTVAFGFRRVRPEEKASLVSDHFDRVASTYDLGNTLLSLGIHHLWKRVAVRMTGIREGDKVLDVCGGTGDLALLAAKRVGTSGRVVLYDFNRRMMEKGVPKITRSPWGGSISLVQGDAERIAGREGAFDAAMVGFGVRNLTRMEQGFREMHRVLRPGGRLMCLEFSRPTSAWFRALYDAYSFSLMPVLSRLIVGTRNPYSYLAESIRLFPSPDELSALLRGIGFRDVAYRRLTNGIAAVHLAVKPGEETQEES